MTNCFIKYGNTTIQYSIEYKVRKNIAISVLPDLSVIASAPLTASKEVICGIIIKRAHWILKQKDYFADFLPQQPSRKYVSGETHYYLGKQYRLKIVDDTPEDVKLIGAYFFVHSTMPADTDYIKKVLDSWYKKHATGKFQLLVDKIFTRLKIAGITNKPEIKIKRMKSRWGSCLSEKGTITLNLDLIKTPVHCIEYVIVHELCHLKYPNHDKKFYNLLSSILPDWQDRKNKLEKSVI